MRSRSLLPFIVYRGAVLRRRDSPVAFRAGPSTAERAAPRRKRADGQQEVGGLRQIAGAGGELRGALRRDKAGVAVLPSLELAIEEDAPRRVVDERRQVRIHAGDEAVGAICATASFR